MRLSLLGCFRTCRSRHKPRRVRLHVELLEDRLTPSWAGVPPSLINPPSSSVAVTLTNNDASGSAAISANEADYYRFTATASGRYTIRATHQNSYLDSVIGVFNAAGTRLAYNDDIAYPTTLDSRVTLTLAAGQTYYLAVTNYKGAPGGGYSWKINGPAVGSDDRFENNDTLGTAYNFGTLTERLVTSNLVMADGHDWYRFTTTATGTYGDHVSIRFVNAQGNLTLA